MLVFQTLPKRILKTYSVTGARGLRWAGFCQRRSPSLNDRRRVIRSDGGVLVLREVNASVSSGDSQAAVDLRRTNRRLYGQSEGLTCHRRRTRGQIGLAGQPIMLFYNSR